MSDPAHAAPAAGGAPAAHHHTNYVQIWAILCGLLVVSVAGPFLGIKVVTMITAFGIAIVKAYLVATKFMHLNIEKKFVAYILGAMVTLMLLFFGGVSPDVLKHEGARWNNDAAKSWVDKHMKDTGEHEEHGPAAHHEGGAEHHQGTEKEAAQEAAKHE